VSTSPPSSQLNSLAPAVEGAQCVAVMLMAALGMLLVIGVVVTLSWGGITYR
jgi:hypothetical protein